VLELSIRTIEADNEVEKIPNAETGKPRKENAACCNLFGFH
jgi:hypothetical protein